MKNLLRKNQEKSIRKLKTKHPKQQTLNDKLKTLNSNSNIWDFIVLPPGEDINEWIALNTFNFFTNIQTFYEMMFEICTQETCPHMCIGDNECRWKNKDKTLESLPAMKYIDNCLNYCQEQLDNPKIFPNELGVSFSEKFLTIVKLMFKRMFRVYGHFYFHHFDKLTELDVEKHLNSSFKRFICFAAEFDLIDLKEVKVLENVLNNIMPDLMKRFETNDKKKKSKK